jgi:hypothetical protein
MSEIERRLRERGFRLKRWASVKQVEESYGNRKEQFREATTKYVLEVDGYASLDAMHRCIAGGYNFDYLSAQVIDVANNEVIFSMDGHGHSEGCAPLSGTIFGDIAVGVAKLWQ